MKLYPAIDIKDGQCVRLRQGVYEDKTVYSDEPWTVAVDFEKAGAKFIHLVDLDGARMGAAYNDEALKKIIANISIPVEIGGGIRTIEDIEHKLSLGVYRVIIGTRALENPAFVEEAVKKFGAEHIVVGIDAKDGKVAVAGWEQVSDVTAVELGKKMAEIGVKTIIYTDIAKDGMLSGPNIPQTVEMMEKTGLELIASGGVSSYEDIEKLEKAGIPGVIFGKSIYEKKIDVKTAVDRFEK